MSRQKADLTPEEVIEAARVALSANAYFTAAAVAAAITVDSETSEQTLCLYDDGTRAKRINYLLDNAGLAIVIQPLLGGSLTDQAGDSVAVRFEMMVKVMYAPNKADADTVNVYRAVREVIAALCRRSRHPGGEFFRLNQEVFGLSRFDAGLLAYDVGFSKDGVL